MKQRLINIRNKKNVLIAAAFVAAIVIAVFTFSNIGQRSEVKASLDELVKTSDNACYNFKRKYIKHNSLGQREFKENLREFVDGLFNRNSKLELMELEEAKEMLKEYPSDYAEILAREDIYSIVFGSVQGGREEFNRFLANTRLGYPDRMVMAQFNVNLTPIYYLLEYDGTTFHIVEDQTRDDYDDESGYIEMYGKYLKFQDFHHDEGIIEYGFLTDSMSLSYETVKRYFEEMDKGSSDIKKPEFWQFNITKLTYEELNARILTPDTQSDSFRTEYSGFADLHPSFLETNPIMDYDGDGIYDRVYREYITLANGNSLVNVYLFLGNGNTVAVGKDIWGEYFSTNMVDLTGDGNKDICFIQYDNSTVGSDYEVSVLQYRNGNYIAMNLPVNRFSYVTLEESGEKYILNCEAVDESGNTENFYLHYDGEWKKE